MNAPQIAATGSSAFTEKTLLERAAEIIAIGALAVTFSLLFYFWEKVPGRIPIHFGFAGEPDNWGDKSVLAVVVFVQIVIWLVMAYFTSRPWVYSLPLWLNEAERVKMRALIRQMLIFVNAEVMAILTFIIWTTINVAIGTGQSLSVKYMILFCTLILGTVIWFTIRIFRLR
jgi:uncharacterized membrane protein